MILKSPLHQVFCERLKAARKAKNLTQVAVAAAAGISQAAYASLEAGTHCPTLITAEALAAAVGVPLSELLQTAPAPPMPAQVN